MNGVGRPAILSCQQYSHQYEEDFADSTLGGVDKMHIDPTRSTSKKYAATADYFGKSMMKLMRSPQPSGPFLGLSNQ
ncbi:hypothetical protein [Rubritalea tangerina]|uniref:hypothetical protein n=1 Tax=Rubritalea tangerina TaxID=430798 RepID=UPI003618A26B